MDHLVSKALHLVVRSLKSSKTLVAGYSYRESGIESLSRRECSLSGVTLEGLGGPWQIEERGCG